MVCLVQTKLTVNLFFNDIRKELQCYSVLF